MRQIGRLEHVSADSIAFRSISTALPMPGGRVMVNDMTGRRAVILDSTLSRLTPAADTTSATANAYGTSWATLVRYRGDSALLIAPSTLSMLVLAPNGSTAHVLAIPRPNDAQLLGEALGLDTRGRLVYPGSRGTGGILMLNLGMQLLQDGKPTDVMRILQQNSDGGIRVGKFEADSSVVVRVDLESRAVDSAAWVRIPKYIREITVDNEGKVTSIVTTPDPLPVTDQWALLRDGTIAIVRGRDYHIDWVDASGKVMSSPKLPFDWKKVDDARKTALIDSTVADLQKILDDITASRLAGSGRGGAGGSSAGSGRGGGAGDGRRPGQLVPLIAARANLNDLPDYFPPFNERAVTADADDNVWVRTTQTADNRPVYDVINRRGELIDRVQLPAFRTIAGFGPGVIYMAVADRAGAIHLERARVH